jgi:hypothetical protein
VRAWSSISPDTKVAVAHPPYANMTAIIAAKNARNDGVPAAAAGAGAAFAKNRPHTITPAIAAIFAIMNALWTVPPARTPARLTPVSVARASAAVSLGAQGTAIVAWV